jgi:predicted PurR-regulated permease PerM
MTKQIIRFGAAAMTTLLALVVLWQFRIVVVYVLISLALAAAVRPLINRWARQIFLVRLAFIFASVVALGGCGLLLFLGGGSVMSEIQHLAHTVSVQDAWRLPDWLNSGPVQQGLVARLPPPSKLFEAFTGLQGQLVLPAVFGITQGAAGVVSGGIVVLFMSLYWSIHQIHFERLWLSLIPAAQRKQARDIWRIVESDIGAYIRSEVAHSLMVGVVLGLGYWALGSPYPTLLALAGALACLIPMVGVSLALILPLLAGLLTSVQLTLLTVLYTLIVFIALDVWVKPHLFIRRQDNSILTIIILIALANAFGFIGIILAPPVSAVCQIVWSSLVSHRVASGAAAQVSDLKERQARVWETIKEMDEPAPPSLTNSMNRLTHLIEKAEPVLHAAMVAEPAGNLHSPPPDQG